jgi:hypothetical protein
MIKPSIDDYKPEYDDLPEGEFERHHGLKWPLTDTEKAEKLVHAEEAEATKILNLIKFTKNAAYSRIVEGLNLPEWKQRNLAAESQTILKKMILGIDTQDDLDRSDEIEEIYSGQVDPIRDASDLIEADIISGLIVTENAIKTDPRWP